MAVAEVAIDEDRDNIDNVDISLLLSPGSFNHISKSTGLSRVHISKVLRGITRGSDEVISLIADSCNLTSAEVREYIKTYSELRKIPDPGPNVNKPCPKNPKLLGDKVRHSRLSKGITQGRLAELCGLSISYISRIESHSRTPTDKVRRKMAQVLKVRL